MKPSLFRLFGLNYSKLLFFNVVTFLTFFIALLPTYCTKLVIDRATEQKGFFPYELLPLVLLAIVAMHAFRFYFGRYLSQLFCNQATETYGQNLCSKIQSAHIPEYEEVPKSRILNLFNMDIAAVYDFVSFCRCFPSGLLILLCILILLGYHHWIFALLVVLLAPIYILPLYLNRKRLDTLREEERLAGDALVEEYDVYLQNKVSLDLSRSTQHMKKRVYRVLKTFTQKRNHQHFHHVLTQEIPALISTLSPILLLLIGFYFVEKKQMTIGTLVFCASLSTTVFSQVSDLVTNCVNLVSDRAIFRRMQEFFLLPDTPETTARPDSSTLPVGTSAPLLSLDGATLQTPTEIPLFEIHDFTLPQTGLILIQGENGCGKTSLFNYLTGILEEKQLIPGTNYHCTNQLQEKYYMCSPQFLFRGSVEENITCGRTIDRNELLHFHQILQAPDLTKQVEIRPDNLSLGEKQKIYLLRALISQSPVLFLDEPDSNLDRDSALALSKLLKTLSQNRLICLICHNQSYNDLADRIYRIDHQKLQPVS